MMDRNKEFYVGWADNTPPVSRKLLKRFIAVVFIIAIVISALVVYFQKPFNQHQFSFGNYIEVEGILHKTPKPILEIESDQINSENEYILLVGYGKFGAEGIISEIEKEKGELEGKKIKLLGSPIRGDGKYLLELSKKEESLLQVYNDKRIIVNNPVPIKDLTLSGEIIDPKCYFGVMKPGEGKIHKSCAIRCISGGIPAVLKTSDLSTSRYFIILGLDGENINHKLLDYVAEDIALSGSAYKINGWDVININPDSIKLLN